MTPEQRRILFPLMGGTSNEEIIFYQGYYYALMRPTHRKAAGPTIFTTPVKALYTGMNSNFDDDADELDFNLLRFFWSVHLLDGVGREPHYFDWPHYRDNIQDPRRWAMHSLEAEGDIPAEAKTAHEWLLWVLDPVNFEELYR